MTCRCRTPAEHAAREAENRAASERWTIENERKKTAEREADISR